MVADPAALHLRLAGAGAILGFRGRMDDRRLDRHGELAGRDEVLRVRRYHAPDGPPRSVITWKGPVSRSPEGHKLRQEVDLAVEPGGDPLRVLEALGYQVTQAIDRYVEYHDLHGATVRLEWYPRMDVLVEVEGTTEAIEAAIASLGMPRGDFLPDALAEFAARYAARTGQPPVLDLAGLEGESPSWPEAPR